MIIHAEMDLLLCYKATTAYFQPRGQGFQRRLLFVISAEETASRKYNEKSRKVLILPIFVKYISFY